LSAVGRVRGRCAGEHKLARGLLPVRTLSAHWLAHPQFASAVDQFLAREARGIAGYLDELNEHSRSNPSRHERRPRRSQRG